MGLREPAASTQGEPVKNGLLGLEYIMLGVAERPLTKAAALAGVVAAPPILVATQAHLIQEEVEEVDWMQILEQVVLES